MYYLAREMHGDQQCLTFLGELSVILQRVFIVKIYTTHLNDQSY